VVTIPVIVSDNGQSVSTLATVVVRPAAPTHILATPVSVGSTRIAWTASSSAHGYVVTVDGRVVCRTAMSACVISTLLPVDAHVSVTSLGNAHTRSAEAPGRYASAKPMLLAVVHFDTASFSLTRTAKAILKAADAKMRKYGFTRAILHCHTDTVGPFAYNLTLSEQRCLAVASYVKKRLGIAHVQYRQDAFAYLQPIAVNSTAAGKARNRRVEIFVR
jgi:outer membrane protein OmpA-like peptidoglycan-associated protein